ncbi:hypothetical protein ACOMHN_059558 [Nucella lapillus]
MHSVSPFINMPLHPHPMVSKTLFLPTQQTDTSALCVRQPLLHTPPLLPLGLSLSVQGPLTTINMATI